MLLLQQAMFLRHSLAPPSRMEKMKTIRWRLVIFVKEIRQGIRPLAS